MSFHTPRLLDSHTCPSLSRSIWKNLSIGKPAARPTRETLASLKR
ncbi:Uncharacterised protein [Vibrio cholerae]|nr:Uncharacterised protein [Vibrio cholerae]CSI67749.1 Uncharacterised protein [Vibrio cholerae]